MSDSNNVRLVRCPKCDNLLPELADYSVYQCGGCGAVLRANSKRPEGDSLSEKSDEEKVGVVPTKLDNSLEKRVVGLSDASNSDANLNSSSFRRNQIDLDIEKEEVSNTKITADEWGVETGLDTSIDRDELGNAMGKEQRSFNSPVGSTSAFRRSGRMPDWKLGDKGEMEDFRRNPRAEVEGVRFSTSNYPDEGSSSYQFGPSHSFEEPLKKHNDPDGSRAQNLEQDRAELLKKLDELRDQLSRSCDVADKPKEKVGLDARMIPPEYPYAAPDSWFQDGTSGSNRAFMQYGRPDKHVVGSPNFTQYAEPFPYNNGYDMPMASCYPSMHYPNHVPGYGDPFGVPHHFSRQYQQPHSHPYFPGQYVDNNPVPYEPYAQNASFHQPSCSCFHCLDKHRRVAAPIPPSAFSNKRFSDVPGNPMLYHHDNPGLIGSSDPNKSRIGMHSNLHALQSHTRWPSDLNNEVVHARARNRRVVLGSGSHLCHPIAGGAPFLACSNCYEVLRLPKKVLLMEKNQQKVRCGSCSTVINVAIADKKILLSIDEEEVHIPTEGNNGYRDQMVKDSYSHGHEHRNYANFSSDDYDNSGYDFQCMDRDPASLAMGLGLNTSKPQEMPTFLSSSPCTSEDDTSPDVAIANREVTSSTQQTGTASLSPPPPGSPLQEHFDYSANNHLVGRFGKGNRSSRSDQEKAKPNKLASRQNSLKEASLATEMDVSFNEYSNAEISQDSGDASRTVDQPKANKGGDSFFTNIIKKSFRDLSKSNQTDERGRSNVSINGHPLPDRVVKKAEKLAGRIQPGQYWYDFRGGFWGVMNGPGLGIVPPFIEEFNFPLSENCSAGTTGIFVNGRELHQKDLELLAGRGLPKTRDRSYIIEINGKVTDEDTGEELDGLGKLAPTVEKFKRGFGMKPPKTAPA
ncbi:hypothetical protein UlMin_020979 [Ulmus minor]